MSLLNPWMLAALAALAVPIAVHLVAREPRAGAPFPSLMFLSRVALRERRRRQLRDRPLLALRCLALALLALAFAGPHVETPVAGADGAALATVVAVDRSYSMAYAGRWTSARERARAALASVAPDAPVALLLFDTRHEIVTGERAALTARLDAVEPGPRGTDLATALEAAGRWLAAQEAGERQLVLVSDLQRTGLAEGRRVRLPAGVALRVEPVPPGEDANAAIVRAATATARSETRMIVEASVRGTGSTPIDALEVTLEIDGEPAGRERAALGEDGTAELAFEIATPVERSVTARLSLGDDGVAADNRYHLVIAPRRTVRVLVVSRDRGASATAGFLGRALAVATDPRVRVRVAAPDEVAASLPDTDVVIVDDLPLAGAWVDALRRHVEAGGGALAFAGERTRGTWPSGPAGLVPGSLGPEVDRSTDPARLERSRGLPAGLEATRVWRHRTFAAEAGDTVVAALDDGAPLVLERRRGAGRAAAFAMTLDPRWSSLAREPGFVPLIHDLVRRLAAATRPVQAYTVGDGVDLAEHARNVPDARAMAARLRAGEPVGVQGPEPGSGAGAIESGQPLRLQWPGVYTIRSGPHRMRLAANVDARESRFETMPPGALEASVDRVAVEHAGTAAAERDARVAGSERWWWRLVLAATILLLVEAWLANHLSRRRAGGREPRGGGRSGDQPARAA